MLIMLLSAYSIVVDSGCRSHYGRPFSLIHLIVHHDGCRGVRSSNYVVPTSLSFGNYTYGHSLCPDRTLFTCVH